MTDGGRHLSNHMDWLKQQMDHNRLETFVKQSLGDTARGWRDLGIPFACVTVATTAGSTPREQGAVMLVSGDAIAGTIGGGRLEWDAKDRARAMLNTTERYMEMMVHLGPSIGQCCGGRVSLRFEIMSDAQIDALTSSGRAEADARPSVYIYGAGHVGRALARALAPLPFKVTLTDSRAGELGQSNAPDVTLLLCQAPAVLAETAPPGSAHVVMTHSHALDSLIAAAVMERGQFRYLGIIGSRTKRKSFHHAFQEMGLPAAVMARVVCPIGGVEVRDKRPEVIAALTAAEITIAILSGN
jgi:xanthine dehydrogenase accessory factor